MHKPQSVILEESKLDEARSIRASVLIQKKAHKKCEHQINQTRDNPSLIPAEVWNLDLQHAQTPYHETRGILWQIMMEETSLHWPRHCEKHGRGAGFHGWRDGGGAASEQEPRHH